MTDAGTLMKQVCYKATPKDPDLHLLLQQVRNAYEHKMHAQSESISDEAHAFILIVRTLIKRRTQKDIGEFLPKDQRPNARYVMEGCPLVADLIEHELAPQLPMMPVVQAVLSQEWRLANEELDHPQPYDEVGGMAVAAMKLAAHRDRMAVYFPAIAALRVMATRLPMLLIMEEGARVLGAPQAHELAFEFVAIHCRLRASLHRLFDPSAIDLKSVQAVNVPMVPASPNGWPDTPGIRFLKRAGNSALHVAIRVVGELHHVCFIATAPFEYDLKTRQPPDWAAKAASDDGQLIHWCDRGLRAVRHLLAPAVNDVSEIKWEVDAILSQMRAEYDLAGAGGADSKRKTRKHKADAGNRLKADAKRDVVLQWLNDRGRFDGSYQQMSEALKKERNLEVSASTLSRYLKGTKYHRMHGNPSQAARKHGKVGEEREAVSREGDPADLSDTDAWTMPDDPADDGTIS